VLCACTLYAVPFTLCVVPCTLHDVSCIVCVVASLSTMCPARSSLSKTLSTLCNTLSMLCTCSAHSTLYPALCTLCPAKHHPALQRGVFAVLSGSSISTRLLIWLGILLCSLIKAEREHALHNHNLFRTITLLQLTNSIYSNPCQSNHCHIKLSCCLPSSSLLCNICEAWCCVSSPQ
jgi:hypothetical protein